MHYLSIHFHPIFTREFVRSVSHELDGGLASALHPNGHCICLTAISSFKVQNISKNHPDIIIDIARSLVRAGSQGKEC